MRNLLPALAFSAFSLIAAPASATQFTASIPDSVGPIQPDTPGGAVSWVTGDVYSPGESNFGDALLTFELIGYGGIDGSGFRVSDLDVGDDFSFRTGWGSRTSTGAVADTYFNAQMNMGGAFPGTPKIYNLSSDLSPGSVKLLSYTDNGPDHGGVAKFSVPFTLLSGNNHFIFQYGCCTPLNGAEEAWGIRNISIAADIHQVPSVPEPMEWSLLLAGLMSIGVMQRARRSTY